jgi:hypothetical protein
MIKLYGCVIAPPMFEIVKVVTLFVQVPSTVILGGTGVMVGGMGVGGMGVADGGIGVGGMGVADGGIGVGGMGVRVGGIGVRVGGTGVLVGAATAVAV